MYDSRAPQFAKTDEISRTELLANPFSGVMQCDREQKDAVEQGCRRQSSEGVFVTVDPTDTSRRPW